MTNLLRRSFFGTISGGDQNMTKRIDASTKEEYSRKLSNYKFDSSRYVVMSRDSSTGTITYTTPKKTKK